MAGGPPLDALDELELAPDTVPQSPNMLMPISSANLIKEPTLEIVILLCFLSEVNRAVAGKSDILH